MTLQRLIEKQTAFLNQQAVLIEEQSKTMKEQNMIIEKQQEALQKTLAMVEQLQEELAAMDTGVNEVLAEQLKNQMVLLCNQEAQDEVQAQILLNQMEV